MPMNATQTGWGGALTWLDCWKELASCGLVDCLRALDFAVPSLVLLLWLKYALTKLTPKGGAAGSSVKDDYYPTSDAQNAKAWVATCRVRHARFIPTTHAFVYPALYGMYELNALESGQCDAPGAFSWHGLRGSAEKVAKVAKIAAWLPSATAIHPRSHLHLAIPSLAPTTRSQVEGSILRKLAWELRERGHITTGPQDEEQVRDKWRAEIGPVWMVCMPSLVGVQGINPLTTYFVHRPTTRDAQASPLWLCVLEVHNTFSERHLYILEVGKGEDTLPQGATRHRGVYDHAWTFERAFHVSPFNDRGGWYRLLLSPLWEEGCQQPRIRIRLVLLVASADAKGTVVQSQSLGERQDAEPSAQPQRRKKLFATLDSTHLRPLTASTMLWALFRQPFDLLLPFGRILAEAAKLHFKKRLSVFPKPEVRAPLKNGEQPTPGSFLSNDVQARRRDSASEVMRGAIGWQAETSAERTARERLQAYAQLRAARDGPGLQVLSADPLAATFAVCNPRARGPSSDVVITTRSQAIYTDLLLLPSALVHAIGSVGGQRWEAARNELEQYLQPLANIEAQTDGWRTRCARSIRRRHVVWLFSFCEPSEIRRFSEESMMRIGEAPHPLDRLSRSDGTLDQPTLAHLYALCSTSLAARVEEFLVRKLGVHYVSGTEGWLELRRALSRLDADAPFRASWDLGLGSVLAT